MNKNIYKTTKRVLAVTLVLSLALCLLSGCKRSAGTESEVSQTPSDISGMQPVTVFFPDELINFKAASGGQTVVVKGNTAINISDGKTVYYDAVSSEVFETYNELLQSVAGITLGVDFNKLAETYGLKHGTCAAYNKSNELIAVADAASLKEKITVKSILQLNSDRSITYVAPGRLDTVIEGFEMAGHGYYAESGIADDFLILKANFDDGKMVSFNLVHYTI